MAYTITLTDGTVFATVADGTVNTSSSMTLIGKNYAGYGDFLDTNFIHLLENSSNNTAPPSPLTGQLWWDKANGLLKVYNGTTFKTISAATASASAPTSNVTGDLWYDTTNQQLKAWTGAAFIVIGPAYSATQGVSGAIPETILDSVGASKFVTSLYVDNIRVGMVSKDAQFVPQAALLAAFPVIYPGITLSSSVSGARYEGTANNASFLNSLQSSQFMRSDTTTSTTGVLRVLNNSGLFVGATNAVSVSQSSNDALVGANISGGNLILRANVGGTVHNVAQALGSNGTFAVGNAATVGTTLNVTGNITGGNLVTAGLITATGGITSAANVTGVNVNGTVISATGNVQGGNIRTSGLISVTGNIVSQSGNITAGGGTGYFLGNGALLSGLSAAVSVTKFSNGTSEGNIGTPGGNANITIGGVSNVAVFTSTGPVFGVGNVTVAGIDKTGANAVGNIGSSSNYFNRVFATSTSALYADVAERFAADEYLEPGTVVELGGTQEITRARRELSDDVFGVISTRAAYLMNGGAGEDDTHPPVAMTGRVPVKVIGKVNKGDRLVSAGDGLARAAARHEISALNVIGRALESKISEDIGTVEAVVTIK
jgi:hypothetical protein